ncbi:tetratricopeptide repeat protein [Moorena producens]|nr:tetratricopeptide repeat protein [Moorena producens]
MKSPGEQVNQIPVANPNNLARVRSGVVNFVGRNEQLKDLHQQLQEKERIAITTVTGMAGVGKTELAIQYAQRQKQQSTYPAGICWIQVQASNPGEQLLSFAKSQLNLNPPEDWELSEQLDYCWSRWPPLDGDVLYILDDVRDYEDIEGYLPPQESRFKVLITTRKYWLSESFEQLRLEVLDEKAALELLTSFIGKSRLEKESKVASQLCNDLGYLPLGLELVGRFLKRRSDWTLARMVQELEEKLNELKPSGGMTAQRGVEAALALSWEELDSQGQWLGCLLSLFALAPIKWTLVETCLSITNTSQDSILQRWFPTFSRLISSLIPSRKDKSLEVRDWKDVIEYSLLGLNLIRETEQENYQLHQLVRKYFRSKLEQMPEGEKLKQSFCKVMVLEAQSLPQSPTKEQVDGIAPSIPHVAEAATELQQWLEDEDLILSFIGLGRFYNGQGFYKLAEPWLKQCLEVRQHRLGQNHPDVATSLNNLARLYDNQGRYSEAEPLYLQALDLFKQLLGQNHPDVASSLNNLARLYDNQGRYSEAEPLYLQALDLFKQLLGQNHPDVATSLNNLAGLYRNQGRYSEAEPLYLQALDLFKQLLGQNHPYVATSLNNLAGLYRNQGRYSEAEPLYLQALDLFKQLLGQNHPDVATSLNNLAGLYSNQGRYQEAEPLLQQALELKKQLLGQNHPDVASSLNNLAGLYDNQGRYSEAEPLYLQALELTKQLLGQNHPDVASSLNNLAGLYSNQGRYSEAEPLYLQALDLFKQLLGQNHPDVASSLNNLAGLYDNQGRYSEAEPLYLQALELTKQLLGQNHPDVATSLNNLAGLYYNQGRYQEAEPLYLQALDLFKQLLGQNHPYVATSLKNLAGLYYNQGRYSEAEPLYLQALDLFKQLLGQNHPDVASSLNNLALLYRNQGRYSEAEPLYRQALEIAEQVLGKFHPNTLQINRNLTTLQLTVLQKHD